MFLCFMKKKCDKLKRVLTLLFKKELALPCIPTKEFYTLSILSATLYTANVIQHKIPYNKGKNIFKKD